MSINLEKGQRVDVTKNNPGVNTYHVGLGWDVAGNGSAAFDLDAYALILSGGKLKSSGDVVYFNNKNGKGVLHTGDNLTGAGDGDDETIKVNIDQLEGDEVLLAVNIYQAASRKQNFGQVKNAFIRIYIPGATETELFKYDLSEDFSTATGMILGRLYKKDAEWKFEAQALPQTGEIDAVASQYN